MKACWDPDGIVDVSWFHGNSATFIEASMRSASKPILNFHQMSPSIVTVKQDRAIADSGCAVHLMAKIDDVDISVVSYMRLLSRAQRHNDGWLLTGLRAFYLRDILLPVNPMRIPQIDEVELNKFRPSYRFLSYCLAQAGEVPRTDLPGVDRPETVAALRAGEQQWFEQGDN